ncbi:MAG TPA: iron-sulfur cluster-binding protein [Bacillus bacterium]|uniref:Lactate utilization protein B n=1 Tax=Siminovitchia fordii TaxID=254759 RepID=A0ABQ4K729_9BACI|nr:LutB/LldF family L-lactate oxidation iron-sulfur protein [Siminovitchia fordii]GIN20638.1 lactate utilization protein B [Siminovitchia fordii]HBZ08649.1 iron-sulfur cluster-binding protein [Bacillus sp. (in: firmicutes)]
MGIKIGSAAFDARTDEALRDPDVQRAVPPAQERLQSVRLKAVDELGDWERWRDLGEKIRSHTIENLDYYLTELSENVAKRGGHVFFAETAEDANQYIEKVVRQKQAKKIVKSKSMVTEEIGLNPILEKAGCEVVETDLGEYIIQLDNDHPSHFIGPALHKTKEQVRDIFTEKRGYAGTEKPEELTQFAREQLRKEFLSADIGITGCNFAIANSGTVGIVTNEGNARLSTTVPKTQITVMGMERLVPTWADFEVMVSLLCRSAVGQKLSTYVTALSGPKMEGEADGPEEFHLVIVDNGRSSILGTEFQSALHCIRCAACVNVCPVYRHIGGHAYGSIYQGPIGAVLTPLLGGYEEYKELPYASSLCAACTEVCPVRIPLHELLYKHRQRIVQDEGLAPAGEKMAMKTFRTVTSSSRLYRISTKSATVVRGMITGMSKGGPKPIRGWTQSRDLPSVGKKRFRDLYKERKKGAGK